MIVKVGTKKIEVQIDSEDHDKIFSGKGNFFIGTDGYAYRSIYLAYKAGKNINDRQAFHRIVMNATKGTEVDHINGDRKDNRKINLRFCTRAENTRNKPGKGVYKGISYDKINKKWKARLAINKKQYWLGRFNTPQEAAHAYNVRAEEFHGEFARLNVIN